jgi:hypothetical protein
VRRGGIPMQVNAGNLLALSVRDGMRLMRRH